MMLISASAETPEWHVIDQESYRIYWSGDHKQGDFVQVYAPDSIPADSKPKVIVYLHGFALCLPRFYEEHLKSLVAQGYFVIFPDFQRSSYPNPPEPQELDESRLINWVSAVGVMTQAAINPLKVKESLGAPGSCRSRKLSDPNLRQFILVSLALFVVFGLINITISIFNRTWGKNLNQLLSTIGLSLLHCPKEWVDDAIDLTEVSLERSTQDYPPLGSTEPDVFIFGHSLGGLLALSWQSALEPNQKRLEPLQIFTADPAPSTELGIPGPIILLLKLFSVPFATEPLEIKDTGGKLTLPVTILHGADDEIIPPKEWTKHPFFGKQANYDYIASTTKQLYFSLSDPNNSELEAFHNQAVTNTGYFSPDLFEQFGSVKNGANAYNFIIIWPWLLGVVDKNILPQDLASELPPEIVKVSLTLSKKNNATKLVLSVLLGVAGLAAIGYWAWSSGVI